MFSSAIAGLGHTDVSLGLALDRETVFITFLREPVDRLTSLFNFLRGNVEAFLSCLEALKAGRIRLNGGQVESEDNDLQLMCSENRNDKRLHDYKTNVSFLRFTRQTYDTLQQHTRRTGLPWIYGTHNLPPDVPFKTFLLDMIELKMDNLMVRSLAGITATSLVPLFAQPKTPEATLQLAKDVLSKMPFFGLADRFEDSIKLYLWTFGIPIIDRNLASVTAALKRNAHRNETPKIATTETERAFEMEWMDRELYRYSQGLFEERMSQMKRHLVSNGTERHIKYEEL